MYHAAQREMTSTMSEERREILHIRVHIYDTEIPMRIVPEEEELYRRAAKLITNTVTTNTARAQGKKSAIDVLYMALVDIALRYEKEAERNDTAPFSDILVKLTSEIEDALAEDK